MEILDYDDPDEMSFKDEVLLLYSQRLDDRITRKRLLIDRNLLLDDRRRFKSKEERDIANSLKLFTRFTHSSE